MYFVDKENKQRKIRKITVTEGNIYLIRFCDNETIKWAHVMVDEIKNETLSVRTGAKSEK